MIVKGLRWLIDTLCTNETGHKCNNLVKYFAWVPLLPALNPHLILGFPGCHILESRRCRATYCRSCRGKTADCEGTRIVLCELSQPPLVSELRIFIPDSLKWSPCVNIYGVYISVNLYVHLTTHGVKAEHVTDPSTPQTTRRNVKKSEY